MRRRLSCLAAGIAGCLAFSGSPAFAAGLGAGSSAVFIGQPLDFPVQVRLDAGDVLTEDCLSAEVTLGDRRLPAGMVRTALETTGPQSARIRVQTLQAVDEPVVDVLVNASCDGLRLSRRFLVLADPPVTASAPPPPPAPTLVASAYAPAFAATPVDVPASGPALVAVSSRSASDGGATAAPTAAAGRAPTAPAAVSAPRAVTPESLAAQAARAARRAEQSEARRAAAAARRAEAQRTAARAVPAVTAAPTGARLRLEATEAVLSAQANAIDEALSVVAEAASSARAAASAAAVAAARIASLESNVETLRKEASASRDEATRLRERLAVAEQSDRWTWPLLALVLLLTALAAWLVWRLNAAERARQRGWQSATPSAQGPASEQTPSKLPTAPIPFVTSELNLPANPPARQRPLHAWPAPVPPETQPPPLPASRTTAPVPPPAPARENDDFAMQRTEPLPPQGALDDAAARDVSIEELIDLEQQAEFFVVLGQDEAAIDLLVEHLRHTGGGSPLPYLKLLEIYRRRDEREHYERMRARFNHRFNAYAPEWGVDLQAGRSLESYVGVIPRLQQVWARPLDAMAELEALLFRKSRGELFDLPAYREVLFLYSLARDLLDRDTGAGGGGGGSVDLLLPLADGGEFSSTSPAPFMSDATPARDDRPGAREARGTAATEVLDFDLTLDAGPAQSVFDPLEPLPDRPSRR